MAKTPAMDKIIIALDVEDLNDALKLAGLLKEHVGAFKIGKQLFTRYGPEAVRMIHECGGRVFLDLKFHDIPATVAKATREVTRLEVFMFNIHSMGGFDMMSQAVNAVREMALSLNCIRPKILAVTVLTSLGTEDLQRFGISADVEELVIRLARLGKDAGVDGVVASPREVPAIKKECGSDFIVVTPGIRPGFSEEHDQKRTMTPGEAICAGADYIVVGRPVTQAPDPLSVVKNIIKELE